MYSRQSASVPYDDDDDDYDDDSEWLAGWSGSYLDTPSIFVEEGRPKLMPSFLHRVALPVRYGHSRENYSSSMKNSKFQTPVELFRAHFFEWNKTILKKTHSSENTT